MMLPLEEKIEMVKLKDVYHLGISILEFMMGEVTEDRASIALENLPDQWTEFEETTTIIHILSYCLNLKHKVTASKRL
jgi:hypothetical protein